MNSTEPRTQDFAGHEPHVTAQPPGFAPQAMRVPPDSRLKSPGLAAAFSILPGLGQVYVGYYPKGFIHCLVAAGTITMLVAIHGDTYIPLISLFLAFFWMYNIIDAARLAALYNRALSGGREPDLPEGFELPGMGGSILGGAVLVAASFVVLLHTRFGFSLSWVGDWWPVFPMLFGVWLLVKAVKDRASRG